MSRSTGAGQAAARRRRWRYCATGSAERSASARWPPHQQRSHRWRSGDSDHPLLVRATGDIQRAEESFHAAADVLMKMGGIGGGVTPCPLRINSGSGNSARSLLIDWLIADGVILSIFAALTIPLCTYTASKMVNRLRSILRRMRNI